MRMHCMLLGEQNKTWQNA